MLEFQTNRIGALAPPATAPADQPPLQWGPVGLRPYLLYRLLYGDGIPATPSNRVVTAINEVSPGLLLELGRHWTLNYTPTWRGYSNSRLQDGWDHNVLLTGRVTYEDWVLGLSQSYLSTSQPQIETGTQTPQETYVTDLTGSYRFNSKLSTDLAVNQTIVSVEGFPGFKEWVAPGWINYQFGPRSDAGPGVAVGYLAPEGTPDMIYAQWQGRVRWRATDKLSVQLRGGLDQRQFLSGGAGALLNPIFGAVIEYRPFEFTVLSFGGERTVGASYFNDEIVENTMLRAALSQRLLEKLHLEISGWYDTINYVAATSSAASGRRDNLYAFDARLSWAFFKRASAALLYRYTENVSNQAGLYSLTSNQVGLELGYRY